MGYSAHSSKHERMLDICLRLLDGETIRKDAEVERFGVNPRSVQRDIDDLRNFLSERALQDGEMREIIYDQRQKGYRLKRSYKKDLSNGEALAVSKVLLESRSLCKEELDPILDKMVANCVPKQNRKQVLELIANERFNYVEPRHGARLVERLWELGSAVKEQRLVLLEYEKLKNRETVQRLVRPAGIMCSEFYFYLTAFIEDIDRATEFENANDPFPTIYRIDRIKSYRILDEHFQSPYAGRFQEGEFRKRVQFMYGGKLERIKFRYTGSSIEAILDRLPTAQATQQQDGSWLVRAEVFGKGVDMWLKSQGRQVEVLT